ncbi:helix-turn-helix transcriptional regulator [Paenibacillus piri]|nr:AraC family transcriptional regulator [Paenibacillus piri]
MKHLQGASYFGNPGLTFHIDTYTVKQVEIIGEHAHDFVEMAYVRQGSALHHIGGHTYTLRAGDLFVIEPGTPHSYNGSQTECAVICNILFDRNLLYRELQSMEPDIPMLEFLFLLPFLRKSSVFIPHMYISGRNRRVFEQHLETLLEETKRKESGFQLIVKARMIECMVGLSRFYAGSVLSEPTGLTDRQWMEFAAGLIAENYDKTLTLDQVSRMCGMSIASFSAKFKAFTGTTFLEYKHELQIGEACRLLKHTDMKVMAIAHKVGFEDIGFFYKVFRRKMGVTPALYRRL